MRNARRLATLFAAIAIVFGLAACGGSDGGLGAAPEEVAVYTVDIQQPFTGRETRDPLELDAYVDDAVALYNKRKGKMKKDAEESELAAKVNSDFSRANDLYTSGKYEEAKDLYRSIIKTYPLHYGANVNLTLAYLQLQKNDPALRQALVCLGISPDEEGIALNVQAAGVACGFSTDDLEGAIDSTLDALGKSSSINKDNRDEKFSELYKYNKLWDRIETDLYQSGTEGAEEATEGSEEGASAETALANSRAYDKLSDELENLAYDMSEDTDAAALQAYLYVVGLQLGCEADPSLIEPMHAIPYIAVDSDICTIDIKELKTVDDGWRLGFEVTNKLAEDKLSIGHGGLWMVDGVYARTHIPESLIEPGDTEHITLELSRMAEGEAEDPKTVQGTLVVTSRTANTILQRYPISWAADSTE